MHSHEYKKLAEIEDRYWWHVGRKFILRQQMRKLHLPPREQCRILNIGCGTGGTVELLDQFGEVTNADTSDTALAFSKERGIGNLVKIAGDVLPFIDERFDAVVGLDVLEHVADDAGTIQEWSRVLKKGGLLVLTVPAYQWLWSEHDESLQHYRRYTVRRLVRLVPEYTILKKSYIIVFTFFLIVAYRFLQKLHPKPDSAPKTSYVILPKLLNAFLVRLLQWEGALLSWIRFPFGTSILLIAKKTAARNFFH